MLRRHAPLDARQRQRCHDANNTYTSTLLHNYYMVEKELPEIHTGTSTHATESKKNKLYYLKKNHLNITIITLF